MVGKNIFAYDGSQNIFVFEPTLNTLELKQDKGTGYTLRWKSKGVYTSKLKSLYIAFLHGIKLSGYRMGIKFEWEQNTYATKIVNCYIAY